MSLVEKAQEELKADKERRQVQAIKNILERKEQCGSESERLDAAIERVNSGDEGTIREWQNFERYIVGSRG